ncbi:DUF6351 family protein [Streptomyces sp. NPDC050597]|uniref:DUF6351 family protein n=1 Tax=Streptomyces sp. NPDC050597 TaxID=3157212 RepID=UPI0034154CEB
MPSRSRDDIAVNASVGEHERAQADAARSGHRRAPAPGDPRLAAGAPFTNDVSKCQIVLLDRDARGRQLTDAQWDRLRATFPDGVCDHSQESVDAQPSVPWLTYQQQPGSAPLGSAPRSRLTAE